MVDRSGRGRAGRAPASGAGALVVSGLVAGLAGVAAMTVGEKLEQALTGRPNSHVPGRTLAHLLGMPRGPDHESLPLDWAMHWGQGILLGIARGAMAGGGIRGPAGSFLFLNLRLASDQALENATGVGAPPWTWPLQEQLVDLLHKAVYAGTAGVVADLMIEDGRHGVTDPNRGPFDRDATARHRGA